MNLDNELFHENIGGKNTSLHFLENANLRLAVTNYGARMVSIIVPDREHKKVDVVVGFDSLKKYLDASEPFHGTIVGRFANRIARGKFSLNGKNYQLSINNKPNHLHGGPNGFHNQVWKIDEVQNHTIRLSYFSPDGEENYPGNLQVRLKYHVTNENEIVIDYAAETDQATVINLTSHPFFNLNGQGCGMITKHMLQVQAANYNPVDKTLIPTGIAPVENTPFDFRKPTAIGARIDEKNQQLQFGSGYDHNFVLDGHGFRSVARVTGDQTGIVMEVLTDQPGMQLYTGNFMKGDHTIKYGLNDTYRSAFCLETQHFPDAPNQPAFPSTILEPGEVFQSRTIYRFSLQP